MSPRSVSIDAVGIAEGGGFEVLRDLVFACAARDEFSMIRLYVSDPRLRDEFESTPNVRTRLVGRSYGRRFLWWLIEAMLRARISGSQAVLHAANIAVGPSWGIRRAVLVHQPNILPRAGNTPPLGPSRGRYRMLRSLVRWSVRRVDVVFVQSDFVADRIVELAGRPISVRVARPTPPSSLPEPGNHEAPATCGVRPFVYIGSAAPHKNVGLLVRAADSLMRAVPTAEFVISLDERSVPSRRGLRSVGPMSRSEVAGWLASSEALVMPSFAETVGLPMLEAMRVGVPVLAADLPYAHAICGDAALYFDPTEPQALVNACRMIATDEVLRRRIVTHGQERIKELESRRGDRLMAEWLAGDTG